MSRSGRFPWVVICALGTIIAGLGGAMIGRGGDDARAQGSSPPPDDPPADEATGDEGPKIFHRPNQQYPHSPEEESYEAAPTGRKAGLDAAAEWSETKSGDAVHQAWSAYARERKAAAEVEHAARAAGVQGTGDVGVE
jgi:hypothetical protein